MDRPQSCKEAHKRHKVCDDVLHAQVGATRIIVVAPVKKVACLEDQNLLFLMTTPRLETTLTTHEYI